jgi:hypothetical protein
MLRITADESRMPVRLRLEGKLTGPWVAELAQVYRERRPDGAGFVFDLEGLTGADEAGRSLLTAIRNDGVAIENVNPLNAPLLFGSHEVAR